MSQRNDSTSSSSPSAGGSLTLSTRSPVHIPQLGFGTYLSPRDRTHASCLAAIKTGYRHIDTAQYYANEREVGLALAECGLPRDQLFITTKILTPGNSADETYAACLSSVHRIGSHVDLFLIHSPSPGIDKCSDVWRALERLYSEGKARAIGVSNFGIAQIEALKGAGKVWPPHVNQIELHPWTQQKEIVQYCHDKGIVIEAYCPIVRNQKADNRQLLSLAAKHSVTPNQVLIRWSLQKGWVCLPKSDSPERIKLNADVYGFNLDQEDMDLLNSLDQGREGAIVMVVNNS